MSNDAIRRALDKQAKLEAEARWPLPDAQYLHHFRNQAKLARAVIKAAAAYEESQFGSKDAGWLASTLAVWADHVNGDTP